MGSISNDTITMTAVQKLRAMLADPDKFIACPGVYDGFTARIALQEGVDCLYMVCYHGHSLAASTGKNARLTSACRPAQVPR
jgi:2-methylisocitrate lyase-like PEP mutase family enzyme